MSSTATTAVFPSLPVPHFVHPSFSTAVRSKSRRRLSKLAEGTHRSMDTAYSPFSRLSSELLALICLQLSAFDKKSLWELRRVDRRLSAIATPYAFRTLVLNASMVDERACTSFSEAFKCIERFTKHIVVGSSAWFQEPALIRDFLRKTGKLQTITWRFSTDELRERGSWLPSEVLDVERLRRDGTKLLIEELPMRRFVDDAYNHAVPACLLTSLRLARPTPPLTTHLASLKSLLMRARNLEVFHYQDRGQGTQFDFQEGERLPPFKDLRLRSYDWDHSAEGVRDHWDFSKLGNLVLDSVPTLSFLKSIDLDGFPKLRGLEIDDWSPHRPNGRVEATRLLGIWVEEYLQNLRSLKITCDVQSFPCSALLAHRDTLEVLHLRDYAGFRDDSKLCPTWDSQVLGNVAKQMKRVHTLVIDFEHRQNDTSAFLEAILGFPHLKKLTIHTQTSAGRHTAQASAQVRHDIDHDTAWKMATALNQHRIDNDMAPFIEITINMGDWKPIMVRRLGARWRALNEKGIFAERCFVVRRIDGESKMWEERGAVHHSPRATPDPTDYSEGEDEDDSEDDLDDEEEDDDV